MSADFMACAVRKTEELSSVGISQTADLYKEVSMTGYLAIARAGHDKGVLYVIVGEDETHVYLCDGKARGMSRPKKKNRRHVQIIKQTVDPCIVRRLIMKESVFDHEIKYAIKQYLATRQFQ